MPQPTVLSISISLWLSPKAKLFFISIPKYSKTFKIPDAFVFLREYNSNKLKSSKWVYLKLSSVIESTDNIHIIYIGGDYNSIAGGTIGSHAIDNIKNYHCNKAFVGCVGVNAETGNLSTSLSEDANTKRAIMNISKELYLLLLNRRFNIDAVFNFGKLSEFDSIITEDTPDSSIMEELEKQNVHLI